MDTKSKKWKSVVSYAVFVLGISLLIGCGLFALNRYFYQGESFGAAMQKAFEEDYQNTDEFRWEVADNLETFIAMATGGPLRQGWYGYSGRSYYDYYDSTEDGGQYTSQVTVAEEQNIIEETAVAIESAISEIKGGYGSFEEFGEESDDYSYDGNEWEEDYPYTPEQNEKAAKRAHEYRKNDKNVLYTVAYENEVVFDNTDGMVLDGVAQKLPEGYNFLLYFDGNKVTIIKDGKEIDVYQDGFYRESSDWYVPGYKNFTVDEKTKKATVCIGVAKNPTLYVKGNYSSDGTAEQNNSMYWIVRDLKYQKRAYISWLVLLMAAIVCLAAAAVFRIEKKKGDCFFAKITGKIWFEGKLLVLLLIFALIINACRNILEEFYWVFRGEESFYSGMFIEYAGNIGNEPLFIFLIFWTCYLLVNDVRHNKRVWQHGIIAHIMNAFSTKHMKLTFQKRMLQRSAVVLAIGTPIVVVTVIVMTVAAFYGEMYIFIPLILLLLISQGLQIAYANKNKEISENIGNLVDQIKAVRNGNLTKGMKLPADSDLSEAAEELNDIRQGMDAAVEEKIKSERMKVELVSNVSHDIKTPLTSIISYIDLLKQEDNLPLHVRDYVNILDNKSQRLKVMIQDVFEVSKAVSGQLPVVMEILDLQKLLWQTLADMEERIKNSEVTIRPEIPKEAVMIQADGQRLYRVFQNLIQNALQYSLEGSRVHVSLKTDGHMASASIKNTSKYEISKDIDFTERFTRGDESRTDGGSGLGLSIANSFTQACGGVFRIDAIADLFVVTVEFELTE